MERHERPEAELVTLSQGGNLEAFQELIGRYQRRLFGLCYRLLGRSHDAEDATQEALLRAYRYLGRYDPSRPFDRWLLTIAANCCVSMLRRRRPEQRALEAVELDGQARNGRRPANPVEEVQAQEFADAVAQAIAELREPYRSAFVLLHQEEMSYEEIAEVLDLPVGTVKSRVHRAREQLYERLSQAGFLPF